MKKSKSRMNKAGQIFLSLVLLGLSALLLIPASASLYNNFLTFLNPVQTEARVLETYVYGTYKRNRYYVRVEYAVDDNTYVADLQTNSNVVYGKEPDNIVNVVYESGNPENVEYADTNTVITAAILDLVFGLMLLGISLIFLIGREKRS